MGKGYKNHEVRNVTKQGVKFLAEYYDGIFLKPIWRNQVVVKKGEVENTVDVYDLNNNFLGMARKTCVRGKG